MQRLSSKLGVAAGLHSAQICGKKFFDALEDALPVPKGGDAKAYQVLVPHVDQHVQLHVLDLKVARIHLQGSGQQQGD